MYIHTPEEERDYELLKKKPANLSNSEMTYTSPEKMHTQQRFGRPSESLARLMGEDLSLVCIQSLRIGKVAALSNNQILAKNNKAIK